jgi:hypothetical protein
MNALRIFGTALVAVGVLACTGAMALTSSNADARSGSAARSDSAATIRQTIVMGAGGGSTNAATAGEIARAQGYRGQAGLTRNEQGVEYSGGTNNVQRNILEGGTQDRYRATVRNTPDAFGPNVSGGTNPCTAALSGGLALPGFGASIGGAWSEEGCERRQLAALLHNTGQPELAQELLCNSPEVRQARARMGTPCMIDRPQQVAAAPVVYVPAGQPVAAPVAAIRPDWCYSATIAERRATARRNNGVDVCG